MTACAAVALAAVLLATSASGADPRKLGKVLDRLPAAVRTVASAGGWGGPQGIGFYRAVVLQGGADAVVEELVIQWVLESAKGTPVVASVRPHEVNDAGLIGLRLTWDADGKSTRLLVDGTHRETKKHVRIGFALGAPGTYRVEREGSRPRP